VTDFQSLQSKVSVLAFLLYRAIAITLYIISKKIWKKNLEKKFGNFFLEKIKFLYSHDIFSSKILFRQPGVLVLWSGNTV
jgi:hypothetical protein